MRIVHVATTDTYGGAARSAYRLHEGLCEAGVDSRMFTLYKDGDNPTVQAFEPSGALPRRFALRARQWTADRILKGYKSRPAGLEPFDNERGWYPEMVGQLPECDLLHLHWVASFVDYPTFFAGLRDGLPMVWTLHDVNPLTGGCHFTLGCRGFLEQCGRCPQLGSRRDDDLSRRVFTAKDRALGPLSPSAIHVVGPSRWITDEARRSPLMGKFDASTIPYGVDTAAFHPMDQMECRRLLGIPLDAPVALFVAAGVDNARKGFGSLLRAFEQLGDVPGLLCVSVGEGAEAGGGPVPMQHLGKITDEQRLVAAFNAADVFVVPSVEDNLPNTVLEALACGTPVAGYAVGGIPDMVRPGVTGELAPAGDAAALAGAIRKVLSAKGLREQCRAVAVTEYTFACQSAGYLKLYQSLLAAAPASSPYADTFR